MDETILSEVAYACQFVNSFIFGFISSATLILMACVLFR